MLFRSDEFTSLVTNASLTNIVLVERSQYLKLTNIFVQSFNFNDDPYHPSVEFMLYERPCRMLLSEFCSALGVRNTGLTGKMNTRPQYLKELYAGICHDDWRDSTRAKFWSIQFPAVRYLGYVIARCILPRDNTSNMSSHDLAILAA